MTGLSAGLTQPNRYFAVHPQLGIGRVDKDARTFAFFDTPAVPTIEMPIEVGMRVSRHILESQQRVWWHDGTRWIVGRVVQEIDGGLQYRVDFPNQISRVIPADELHVRWARAVEDPTGLLIAGTVETRFFHQRRSAFISDLSSQRSACEGFGGILSSAIDFYPHQIGAARKILRDPIRRYLLADEVGLGKSIEAGMVIRQLLLDEPGKILVLVPGSLVAQWKAELAIKFMVDDFPRRVDIQAHEDIARIPAVPRLAVVVDEAHRLTSNSGDAKGDLDYERLCSLSHAASALLLLSATPVRSNEDTFLRLLHLLDPENYPLTDVEWFRQRVRVRDEIGEAIGSLDEELPIEYLLGPLEDLIRLLPGDSTLDRMLAEVRGLIEAQRLDEEIRASIRAIVAHVSETHRIHRRMIRTRRTDKLRQTFPVRGRKRTDDWLVTDFDPRRSEVLAALDDFLGTLNEVQGLDQAAALRAVLGRVVAPMCALSDLVLALQGHPTHDLTSAEIEAIRPLVGTDPALAFAAALERAVATPVQQDRLTAMSDWMQLRLIGRKIVVASSYAHTATQAADHLAGKFGQHRVASFLTDSTPVEREIALRRFSNEPSCSILVLDGVGDEGLNLQFVDEVLHLDLPTVTNRLEQRLGRFDRWVPVGRDRAQPVKSFAFRESDPEVDAQLGAWRTALADGLSIFDHSVATLQYELDDIERKFQSDAVEQGFEEAGRSLASSKDELERLRKRIQGQDLLDSLDDRSEEDSYAARLTLVDSAPRRSVPAIDYMVDTLRFARYDSGDGLRFSIKKSHPPLLTASELDVLGLKNLAHPFAVSRIDRKPGQRLLRWGEPFVDRIGHFAEADDRGRAFAIEVRVSGGDPFAEPLYFIGFEFLLRANTGWVDDRHSDDRPFAEAVKSRVLRLFPPRHERVWWSPGKGECPEQLRIRLDTAAGDNLGSRPERFQELLSGLDWRVVVEATETSARQRALERPGVTRAIAESRDRHASELLQEETRFFARRAAGFDRSFDTQLFDAVEKAISSVIIEVDSCGAVIVTPEQALR